MFDFAHESSFSKSKLSLDSQNLGMISSTQSKAQILNLSHLKVVIDKMIYSSTSMYDYKYFLSWILWLWVYLKVRTLIIV